MATAPAAVVLGDEIVGCAALGKGKWSLHYNRLAIYTWSVDHVVNPSSRLLYTQFPPLCLAHQSTLRNVRGHVLRENDVSAVNRQFPVECK